MPLSVPDWLQTAIDSVSGQTLEKDQERLEAIKDALALYGSEDRDLILVGILEEVLGYAKTEGLVRYVNNHVKGNTERDGKWGKYYIECDTDVADLVVRTTTLFHELIHVGSDTRYSFAQANQWWQYQWSPEIAEKEFIQLEKEATRALLDRVGAAREVVSGDGELTQDLKDWVIGANGTDQFRNSTDSGTARLPYMTSHLMHMETDTVVSETLLRFRLVGVPEKSKASQFFTAWAAELYEARVGRPRPKRGKRGECVIL